MTGCVIGMVLAIGAMHISGEDYIPDVYGRFILYVYNT